MNPKTLTEADREEIRQTINEGRQTGRWAEPGNRQWTTSRGHEAAHGEEEGRRLTQVWTHSDPTDPETLTLTHSSDHDGEI